MRRIGHLVGIDADEAALAHAATAAPGWPARYGSGVAAERGVQQPAQPTQKRVGPAGLHLDDQRLAFMRRHAGRLDRPAGARRLPAGRARTARGRSHAPPPDGLGKVGLMVARGDPHIGWRPAGERMRRAVQPRRCSKSSPRRSATRAAQLLLRRDGKRTGRSHRRWRPGLAFLGLGQRLGQERS